VEVKQKLKLQLLCEPGINGLELREGAATVVRLQLA
jgi:hypothetical protein